jgi:threonine synthase
VLPVGNLGNVSAIGNGFLMMKELGLIDRLPRIACAQAEKANPLYLSYQTDFREYHPVSAQKTLASAIQIGNPVSYERAVKVLQQLDGVVEQVGEAELADAAARADRTGLYACPHTGVALGALFKLLDKGVIRSDECAVVISTAHGLKFSGFKVAYHTGNLGDGIASQFLSDACEPKVPHRQGSARYANPPIELPADYGAVIDAIDQQGLK